MFSVLISVYRKESPFFFKQALESIALQSLKPKEIVIIEDGPITKELDDIILVFEKKYFLSFEIIRCKLERNLGLGLALKMGLLFCNEEFIARMDSDDISLPGRFEKMKDFIEENPGFDVYGSQIQEFDSNTMQLMKCRKVKLTNQGILSDIKFRNPMNHVTVIFRKDSVISAGNYDDSPYFEDYKLWAKMINKGYKFINHPEVLVHVRAGKEMVKRRKGWKYAVSEYKMQKYLLETNLTSFIFFVAVSTLRISLRFLPGRIVAAFYSLSRS